MRHVIKATGARVAYLPPYSADFNSIKNAYLKLKALLLRVAAGTVPDLHDAITPVEYAYCFTTCGYKPE